MVVWRSGCDGCCVEQAGQSVPRSSVDHHPGCASWVAIALPAHISAIQGNTEKYYWRETFDKDVLSKTIYLWREFCIHLNTHKCVLKRKNKHVNNLSNSNPHTTTK